MSLILILPLFIGWLAGLTINYLADVLPETRSFSPPVCQVCKANFSLKDYLLFKPCLNGHTRKNRTWIVLLYTTVTSLYIWYVPPEKIGYSLGITLAAYFGLVFVIDLEHRLILHPTSIFGILLGSIIGIIKRDFLPTLYGALGGLIIMLFLYYMGVLFARYRANRMRAAGQETDDEEALGAGDVILVTILGLILGWPVIWFGLLAGILLGGVVSLCLLIWLIITGRYSSNALMMFIPYGPYLITSAFVLVFFSDYVSNVISG